MSKHAGKFVWYELMTSDMKSASDFYSKVFGWTCRDSGMPGMPYWIFSMGDMMTAGLMGVPEDAAKMGAKPSWSGYIEVADVDQATAKVKSLGGRICKEPMDIPNVGRFSVVTDPQGAFFELFSPAMAPPGEMPPHNLPGRIGWNELYALDMEKVAPFYEEMFGWTKDHAVDMGPMGKYQMFKCGDEIQIGMMNKPPQMPVAIWDFYVNVGDIDAAVERAKAAGGQIVNGPMAVPNDDWIAQGLDPQGALFAMVGKRKA